MIPTSRFIIVWVLLSIVCLYLNLRSDITVPINKPLGTFPVRLDGWRVVSESFLPDAVLDLLKPTDYLDRTYTDSEGRIVHVYIGYHAGGKNGGSIHSPKHCLPGSGWYRSSEKKERMIIAGGTINLIIAIYQKGDSKVLFVYWYETMGKTLSDEYSLRMAQIAASMFHNRSDSSFIRLSVPFETDESEAFSIAADFARALYPTLKQFLPTNGVIQS